MTGRPSSSSLADEFFKTYFYIFETAIRKVLITVDFFELFCIALIASVWIYLVSCFYVAWRKYACVHPTPVHYHLGKFKLENAKQISSHDNNNANLHQRLHLLHHQHQHQHHEQQQSPRQNQPPASNNNNNHHHHHHHYQHNHLVDNDNDNSSGEELSFVIANYQYQKQRSSSSRSSWNRSELRQLSIVKEDDQSLATTPILSPNSVTKLDHQQQQQLEIDLSKDQITTPGAVSSSSSFGDDSTGVRSCRQQQTTFQTFNF